MKKRLFIFFISLLFIIIISLVSIKLISNKISPLVMDYSISEMKRIISIIINRSINSDLLEKINLEKMFIVNKDDLDDISTISLDSVMVNKITDIISDACEDNLRLIEDGKYDILKEKFNINRELFYVPSGIILKTTLFNSIGPKIPINLKFIGNVTSNLKTDVKDYGINNSLITISIDITVEMMVILPFSSDYVKIDNSIPIMVKLIHGKVPDIYGGNLIK